MSFSRGTTFANRLSGGGNPTGYSESGGTVTLSDELVIDAGAIETKLAAATADGTLAISDPNGVAAGALALRNAANTANKVYAYSPSDNGSVVLYDSVGNYRTSLNGSSGGGVGFGSDSAVTWSSNALAGDSVDTKIARASAGVVAIGDGTTAGALHLLDSAGNADAKVFETGGGRIAVDGAAGIYFYQAGVGKFWTNGDNFLPWTAGTQTLGNTGYPFGSLTLGDGTAQVLLGHDGATDGLLQISDPNGVANGTIRILDAAGIGRVALTTLSDGVVLNCPTGGAIYFQHSSSTTSYLSSSGVFPGSTGKTLGSTAAAWNALTLGDGTAQVLLNHDGATDGLLRISDPNGVAAGTLNLLTAAGAAETTLRATGYNIQTTGANLDIRGGSASGQKLTLYDGSVNTRLVVDTTEVLSQQTGGDITHRFANQWGAGLSIKSASQELTALSGASASTTNLVPAGCTILYVVARVTTLITGATTFDVGDGTDVDRYGAAIAVAAGTTVDETDGTADPRSWSASAQDVTLTANGSNFTAGAVRITAFYLDPTAPTS